MSAADTIGRGAETGLGIKVAPVPPDPCRVRPYSFHFAPPGALGWLTVIVWANSTEKAVQGARSLAARFALSAKIG
jgi:hypothetical protein